MKKKYFLIVLLLILIGFEFWDVIQHPQLYYDDLANIFNTTIASKKFDWNTIKKVLTFSFGGFRPVSYFSFYLNYFFWGNGTESLFSFILFNVILHFFNSVLVFFLSMKLTKNNFKISSFTSIAWALSPANSFAVVYLVQRMTELMFFFGFISFLFFITYFEQKKKRYFFLSMVFLFLSILSKQNGLLIIPLFVLYPLWFGDKRVEIAKLYLTFVLFYILFLIVAGEYFLPQSIVRGFTPVERLLTETRVLVYYLKVLILPFTEDIFLYIDFPLSKSLFNPVTTLFSVVLLILLFYLSYLFYKKDRLVSFGLLSFFIFHSIESSTIPLYIAFLHRNYVPSFFLYLAFFTLLFRYIKKDTIPMLIALIIVLNLIFISKIHNVSYTSPIYYLSQNYKSFPSNKDLCAALGRRYNKTGNYREAIDFFIKSFKPDKLENRLELVMVAFYNMKCYQCVIHLKSLVKGPIIYQIVGKAYKKMGDFECAEYYFKESLKIGFNNNTLFAYLDLLAKQGRFKEILKLINRYSDEIENGELAVMYEINSYIELGMFDKAKPLFDCLKTENVYFWLKGKYFLKKGKIDNAIKELNKIKISVFTAASMFIEMQKVLLLSDAYVKKGDFKTAIEVLSDYSKKGFYENVVQKQIENIRRMRNVK